MRVAVVAADDADGDLEPPFGQCAGIGERVALLTVQAPNAGKVNWPGSKLNPRRAHPRFFGSQGRGTFSQDLFSFITLTTTGYGNLVHAGNPGQAFAVIEMLTAQLFLVNAVSRSSMAGGWVRARRTAGIPATTDRHPQAGGALLPGVRSRTPGVFSVRRQRSSATATGDGTGAARPPETGPPGTPRH